MGGFILCSGGARCGDSPRKGTRENSLAAAPSPLSHVDRRPPPPRSAPCVTWSAALGWELKGLPGLSEPGQAFASGSLAVAGSNSGLADTLGRTWRGTRARTRVPGRFLSVPLGGEALRGRDSAAPVPGPAGARFVLKGAAPAVRPRSSGFRPLGARARRDVPSAAERGEDRVLRALGWGYLRRAPPRPREAGAEGWGGWPLPRGRRRVGVCGPFRRPPRGGRAPPCAGRGLGAHVTQGGWKKYRASLRQSLIIFKYSF